MLDEKVAVRRVLVVEDEFLIRMTLAEALGGLRLGHVQARDTQHVAHHAAVHRIVFDEYDLHRRAVPNRFIEAASPSGETPSPADAGPCRKASHSAIGEIGLTST